MQEAEIRERRLCVEGAGVFSLEFYRARLGCSGTLPTWSTGRTTPATRSHLAGVIITFASYCGSQAYNVPFSKHSLRTIMLTRARPAPVSCFQTIRPCRW